MNSPGGGTLHTYDDSCDDLVQCQCSGCGEYRGVVALGRAHACWRNEDGTYEEGGTFQ